tara:strand:- start:256 stop:504 length:249 start_codon:yes stop_codon:yes gene_type:complete
LNPRSPLTRTQHEVFCFIRDHWQEVGRCPSLREVCKGEIDGEKMMKSRASVSSSHKILQALISKGWLVEDWEMNVTFWRVAP